MDDLMGLDPVDERMDDCRDCGGRGYAGEDPLGPDCPRCGSSGWDPVQPTLMDRCRAAVCYVNSKAGGVDTNMFAFLSLFHPDLDVRTRRSLAREALEESGRPGRMYGR